MGLFKKKPKIQGPVPLKEIQSLRSAGLSDKEIIKRLKDRGYDYKEIERALLQSIRSEVTSPSGVEARETQTFSSDTSPTFGDVFSSKQETTLGYGASQKPLDFGGRETKMIEGYREDLEDFSDLLGQESVFETPIEGEETVSPEVTIEEIVEGVIAEKWAPIEKEIQSLRNDQENIRKDLNEIKMIATKIPTEESKSSLASKIQEIEERLNNLEPKVNGLEKAFKQFLPTLTDNIRMLSQIVEKMKEKRSEETQKYDFTERAIE